MTQKILLTGVSGFIGNHLALHLLRQGHEVSVVVRSQTSEQRIPPGVICYDYDGSSDSMLSIVESASPDVVFHLASAVLPTHKPSDLDRLVDSNIRFGLHLLEAMAHIGCRHFVNTGTGWQHDGDGNHDPVCLYAATKSAFESLIQYYVSAKHFSVVTLKLHDTYGLNDPRGKLISLLIKHALNGLPIDLSPGEQKLDLVHVDDVVEAFSAAADYVVGMRDGGHHQFMVSSGNLLSIKDLVREIEIATNRKIIANWGARAYREREVMVPWSQGNLLPGWKPEIDLRKGILSVLPSD